MELPAALRRAVDAALEGVPLVELQREADRLSQRYRAETRDGRLHIAQDRAALGYIAARLPATYAAVRESLERVAEIAPDFMPASLLDIGCGPGTALWAAMDCWPGLGEATMLDASGPVRALGERLARGIPKQIEWREHDVARNRLDPAARADLVTLSYVLDELDPARRPDLVREAWNAAQQLLLVVEPGTPAGWRRILEARAVLLGEGATLAAPCPHHEGCPLTAPDWCHFARRVARSSLHRQTKRGEAPFEDEKYIYLAASRFAIETPSSRVLAPPRAGTGKVALKLCCEDGRASEALITRREGERFRIARRAGWGDIV